MKEKDIQSLMHKPLSNMKRTFFYELKLSKNPAKTVPFSKFESQQLRSLLQIKHSTLAMKISDEDSRKKFGDGFVAYQEDSFVALCYYVPRQPKIVYFITIDEAIKLREAGKRSIHLNDAIGLHEFLIDLG